MYFFIFGFKANFSGKRLHHGGNRETEHRVEKSSQGLLGTRIHPTHSAHRLEEEKLLLEKQDMSIGVPLTPPLKCRLQKFTFLANILRDAFLNFASCYFTGSFLLGHQMAD